VESRFRLPSGSHPSASQQKSHRTIAGGGVTAPQLHHMVDKPRHRNAMIPITAREEASGRTWQSGDSCCPQ
jgi:hypothetical protein